MSGHSKWATIRRKKEKNDAARGKIFTRIGRELAIAVREGGADPTANSKLRDIIAKAKANNIPNDNITRIIKKSSDAGVKVIEGDGKDPLYVPADNFMINILQKVYEDATGQKANLISIGGGTYARAIKNAVAFGPLFPGKEETAHQKNEYIEIDDLMMCTKIYAKAIYELVK